MTRKHFEAIAKVLAAEYAITNDNPAARFSVNVIMYSLADVFFQENPRFDRQRFYNAVRNP